MQICMQVLQYYNHSLFNKYTTINYKKKDLLWMFVH